MGSCQGCLGLMFIGGALLCLGNCVSSFALSSFSLEDLDFDSLIENLEALDQPVEQKSIPYNFHNTYVYEKDPEKELTVSSGSISILTDKDHILSAIGNDTSITRISYQFIKVKLEDSSGGHCEGGLDLGDEFLVVSFSGSSDICTELTGRWVEESGAKALDKSRKTKARKKRKTRTNSKKPAAASPASAAEEASQESASSSSSDTIKNEASDMR